MFLLFYCVKLDENQQLFEKSGYNKQILFT
ncbi:Uncharacterised protein [Actinobacillus delphinicola]|uniref:Uncharacterized protein n=1 Tax=Actinobacillus delphinicola TaxID=51161 RepID=A0A448TVP7_9PAST|nr:Uncharacterised protein [Actinobacillus delphinicola]